MPKRTVTQHIVNCTIIAILTLIVGLMGWWFLARPFWKVVNWFR